MSVTAALIICSWILASGLNHNNWGDYVIVLTAMVFVCVKMHEEKE
jgi:hypothetical protein